MTWNWPAVLGLIVGGFTLAWALPVAAAGHGWGTALFMAPAAVVLCPLAFQAAAYPQSYSWPTLLRFMSLWAALSIALVGLTAMEGFGYASRMGMLAGIWIALWCAPLISLMIATVRKIGAPR